MHPSTRILVLTAMLAGFPLIVTMAKNLRQWESEMKALWRERIQVAEWEGKESGAVERALEIVSAVVEKTVAQ